MFILSEGKRERERQGGRWRVPAERGMAKEAVAVIEFEFEALQQLQQTMMLAPCYKFASPRFPGYLPLSFTLIFSLFLLHTIERTHIYTYVCMTSLAKMQIAIKTAES